MNDAVALAAAAVDAWPTLRTRVIDTLERLLLQKSQLTDFEWTKLAALVDSPKTLAFVVALFERYIVQLQCHRSSLFVQPSSSKLPFEIFVADRLRARVAKSADSLLKTAIRVGRTERWPTVEEIWRIIASWGGYLETDPAFSALLQETSIIAQQTLTDEPSCAAPILRTLVILENLDHAHTSITRETLGWCLAVSLNHVVADVRLRPIDVLLRKTLSSELYGITA